MNRFFSSQSSEDQSPYSPPSNSHKASTAKNSNRGDIKNEEDMLNVTVEEARKVLECDRVVIYSLDEQSQGTIVAESVLAGYTRALAKIIKDPCFEARYLEKYRDGRVKALDDIYAAGMTPCYIEQLEKLEVKANLVAPIIDDRNLYGLLVAHQCSQARTWQPQEIEFFSRLAKQLGRAIKRLQSSDARERQPTPTDNRWMQLEADVNQQLYQALNEEEILKTAVREVRNVLNCDRVVVYSLNQQSLGVIVAESVASGWTKALGRIIKDPCFEANYIAKYRDGRVKALNNIYEGGMTPCYIEQLEKLEVKANLVAPILNQGNLYGLLVAHQCSAPRTWQQSEIGWVAQIATQISFTIEYVRLLAERESLQQKAQIENQWTQYFTDAIQQIRSSLNREDILKTTVREVRRVLNCDRAVVYSLNEKNRGVIVAESVTPGYTRALGRTIKDPCFEAKYIEKYRDGRVRALNNIYEAGMTPCYIEQLATLEVKANLVTPILNEGRLFGLLVSHQCSEPREWQQYEIRWVAQLAAQVGFALDNANLLADSQHLQQQAQSANQWTRLLKEFLGYLRQFSDRTEILEATVEEARKILKCDRVVVYSTKANSQGAIVAESVAPGWVRALGKTINDPCFEAKYIAKYRDGRVRALDNIYEGGMTPCYIEQLEKLEVKANLVTSLPDGKELEGLLVAHQCSGARVWQQWEIDFLCQLATQVGQVLETVDLKAELDSLRQQVRTEEHLTQYFTDAIQHIRRSLKPKDILETTVEEVRQILGCDRAVVYSLNEKNRGVIVAESVNPGYTRALGRTIKDPCFEAKYIEKYRDGRVRALNNIYEAGMTPCYIEQLETLQVKANLVTPILNQGKLFGLLVAHQCSNARIWQQHEIRWVAQIATQVGFALDNAGLLQQMEQSSQAAESTSREQRHHIDALKQQISEILNESAYTTLPQETIRQSEAIKNILIRMQGVADSTTGIVLSVQQIKFQEQQANLTIQATQDSVSRTGASIVAIQEAIKEATGKIMRLSQSSQKLFEGLIAIKDLAKQMTQQSMNVTIAAGRTGNVAQESVIELVENVLTLTQQLVEATAKVEPLFAAIDTETYEIAAAMDVGTKQIVKGTESMKETQQQIEQVATISTKMNALIDKITQSATNQTQISTSASQSVQDVTNLADRVSKQSTKVVESFNKLVAFTQRL
jgi:methyl-accepting chemotaxis protein PixJ